MIVCPTCRAEQGYLCRDAEGMALDEFHTARLNPEASISQSVASGAPPSPAPPIFHDEIAHGSEECGVLPVVIDESIPRGEVHFRNKVTGALVGKIINMMAETRPPVASPLPEQTSEYCYHTPSDSCDSDCANQEFADERAESYFRSQAPVPPVALPSETLLGPPSAARILRELDTDPEEPTHAQLKGYIRGWMRKHDALSDENESLRSRLSAATQESNALQAAQDYLNALLVSRAKHIVELEADLASLRSRLTEAETHRDRLLMELGRMDDPRISSDEADIVDVLQQARAAALTSAKETV